MQSGPPFTSCRDVRCAELATCFTASRVEQLKTNVATHDWAVLSRLLDTALSMAPDERVPWVEQLQGEHQSLKPVLRDLLARNDLLETGGFLATLPKLT